MYISLYVNVIYMFLHKGTGFLQCSSARAGPVARLLLYYRWSTAMHQHADEHCTTPRGRTSNNNTHTCMQTWNRHVRVHTPRLTRTTLRAQRPPMGRWRPVHHAHVGCHVIVVHLSVFKNVGHLNHIQIRSFDINAKII